MNCLSNLYFWRFNYSIQLQQRGRSIHVIFGDCNNDHAGASPIDSILSTDEDAVVSAEEQDGHDFIWSDDEESNTNIDDKESTAQQKDETGKYVWSDSDSDDGNDGGEADQSGLAPNAVVAVNTPRVECCEFTSALDDGDEEPSNNNIELDFGNDELSVDLEVEAGQNMRILKSMFPDMKPRKEKIKAGFGVTIIPRYDPTADNSDIFAHTQNEGKENIAAVESNEIPARSSTDEIDDAVTAGEDSVDSDDISDEEEQSVQSTVMSSFDSSIDNITEKEENGEVESIKPETKGDIYEQKELENIFQSAREAETNAPQNSATNTSGGTFSFGFAFPEEGPSTSEDDEFDDDVGVSNVATNATDENQLTGHAPLSSDVKSPETRYPKRRRGMFHFIPVDVLNELEDSFFSLHETDAVQSEAAEKEKWFQERKSLTLDWKRKNKKASKQKRHLQMRKRKFSRR